MGTRVAVPPGVGDVYWALTKLKAYKAKHKIESLHMVIQGSHGGAQDRAGQWAQMVDFIEAGASFHVFRPDRLALDTGVGQLKDGTPLLWPNAVVDRGEHLRNWLPDLELDLGFPVRTTPVPGGPRTVLYVSSEAINTAWMSHLPAGYWHAVIEELNRAIGRVTIIGAKWDRPFFDRLIREAPRPLDIEPLVEATSLMQVADILKHARIYIGVICGMSILANHFRTPCVAIYPTAHNEAFPRTWVAPDAPYWPIRADRVPDVRALGELAVAGARIAA
jgi:hypothetical protein